MTVDAKAAAAGAKLTLLEMGVLLERVKLCFPLAVPGGAQLMAAADEARDWFTDVNALWDEAGALFISFVC